MKSFRDYLNEFKITVPHPKHTLGIARGHMPQVNSSDIDELNAFLKANGVHLKKETVKADTLKATQRNFNQDKILGMAAKYHTLSKAKPILVSADNYVIDGHHRWLGALNVNGNIDIMRADINAHELLDLVHEFPKSYKKNINEVTK